jgi:hypothetical protein
MWLKILDLELKELKKEQFIEPEAEVSQFEKVIGTMTEDQIKLYTLSEIYGKASMESYVQARFSRKEEEKSKSYKKAIELKRKSEVVLQIMWISINEELDLWNEPNLAIRKDYKVVVTPPSFPELPDFIKNFFRRE